MSNIDEFWESDIYLPEVIYLKESQESKNTLSDVTMFNINWMYTETHGYEIVSRYLMEREWICQNDLSAYFLRAKCLVDYAHCNSGAACSRGLIGSSLIAFALGITDVNPLMPHYYCQHCGFSWFFYKGEVQSGFDLPRKNCPKCGEILCSDGHNILFDRSWERKGNKAPLICLDFSANIAGSEFINNLANLSPRIDMLSRKSLDMLSYMEGYPGKMIYDADLCEPEVYKLFKEKNTLGICEFDTDYVNNLLSAVSVEKFSDLVKINGLAHGVGTWENNGKFLINDKVATLDELITSSEDVYFTLISYGIGRDEAYRISQLVKKGRFEKETSKEEIQMLINAGVPEWYIESMKKMEYLFPKSQTVMNAINAARLAWYKVHYPKDFEEAYKYTENLYAKN